MGRNFPRGDLGVAPRAGLEGTGAAGDPNLSIADHDLGHEEAEERLAELKVGARQLVAHEDAEGADLFRRHEGGDERRL